MCCHCNSPERVSRAVSIRHLMVREDVILPCRTKSARIEIGQPLWAACLRSGRIRLLTARVSTLWGKVCGQHPRPQGCS